MSASALLKDPVAVLNVAAAPKDSLTDESYWDRIWRFTADHAADEVPELGTDATTRWRVAVLRKHLTFGARFLEIGVGGSPWPGHVAATFCAQAWGIDYSRPGLEIADRAVRKNHQLVHLIEGDLFDRSKLPKDGFDVVYSGGFLEHFPSPRPVMERIAELVAPRGVVVTMVPNLCGLNGQLQKLVDRSTFERHVVMSARDLAQAHALGGLVPLEPARFVGMLDLSCVNYSRLGARLPPTALRGVQFLVTKLRIAADVVGSWTNDNGGAWLAPAVAGVYRRITA